MKISVLTFSRSKNYGGNLQCYALQHYLESLGHDVEQIDIQRPRPKMSILSKLLRLGDYYYFPMFWRKYIKFSRKYNSVEELRKDPPISNAYIVGSDQVWNPLITQSLDPLVYFLNFAPKHVKRIAYAASFGLDEWPNKNNVEDVKFLLQKFDHIGVREEEAKNLCKHTFDVESELVLDPTFLIDSYDDICGRFEENKLNDELVLFTFVRNEGRDQVCIEIAKKINAKPVILKGVRKVPGFKLKRFVSIADWLRTIRYAKCIITDSFHCTVFCILFHKNFISTSAVEGRNGRLKTLLDCFGLSDRFCKDLKDFNERGFMLLNKSIDYNSVDEKKLSLQRASRDFLKMCLA